MSQRPTLYEMPREAIVQHITLLEYEVKFDIREARLDRADNMAALPQTGMPARSAERVER